MLAYAPRPGREAPHPRKLLLIGVAHLIAISAIMMAKSELVRPLKDPPMPIIKVPITPDPPPLKQPQKAKPIPLQPVQSDPIVKVSPQPDRPEFKTVPVQDPGATTGGNAGGAEDGSGTIVETSPPPHRIVHREPAILTSGEALRPPYPDTKRMLGEEANLTLKLTIDTAGRVIAVEPVGKADPAFLAAARKHLLRVWRFSPASDDGIPIASTKVITLRFVLDEG